MAIMGSVGIVIALMLLKFTLEEFRRASIREGVSNALCALVVLTVGLLLLEIGSKQSELRAETNTGPRWNCLLPSAEASTVCIKPSMAARPS